MTPVFTTSAPGAFCDTSDCNEEFIERMSGDRELRGFPDKPFVQLYIDGTLEDEIGFDIPIWLSGHVDNVEKQPCTVWNVEGDKSFDATIMMQRDPEMDRWVGLITLPSEERHFRG